MVIVVPYRDRREHLAQFASHMERFLAGQQFRVLVMEQADGKPFNRGALLNAGFGLARTTCAWVAFHDVDMLPLNCYCDYSAPRLGMRHLAGAVEQFGFVPPYRNYIGGVLLATVSAFEYLNGFSNSYWGWGCEDDDLFIRACASGLAVERVPGRYRSLPHPRALPPVGNSRQLAGVLGRAFGWSEPPSEEGLRWIRRAAESELTYSTAARELFGSDGLSSLRYGIVDRRQLSVYLGSTAQLDARHELVTVEL